MKSILLFWNCLVYYFLKNIGEKTERISELEYDVQEMKIVYKTQLQELIGVN